MKKSMLLGEIKFYLDELNKKGLHVIRKENKSYIDIKVYYINMREQLKAIDDLIKKHKIKKKYLKYISDLYEYYEEIKVFEYFAYKKLRELKKLRDLLKQLYDNYDENQYLEKLRNKINDRIERFLYELNKIIEDEKVLREAENKYIRFLNKEISYNDEIENYEKYFNENKDYKYKNRIMRIIRKKIKNLLHSNNFTVISIKQGFALILKYEKKIFDRILHYDTNKYYLIDLRNNKVYDITDKIENMFGWGFTDYVDSDELDRFYDIDISDFLI